MNEFDKVDYDEAFNDWKQKHSIPQEAVNSLIDQITQDNERLNPGSNPVKPSTISSEATLTCIKSLLSLLDYSSVSYYDFLILINVVCDQVAASKRDSIVRMYGAHKLADHNAEEILDYDMICNYVGAISTKLSVENMRNYIENSNASVVVDITTNGITPKKREWLAEAANVALDKGGEYAVDEYMKKCLIEKTLEEEIVKEELSGNGTLNRMAKEFLNSSEFIGTMAKATSDWEKRAEENKKLPAVEYEYKSKGPPVLTVDLAVEGKFDNLNSDQLAKLNEHVKEKYLLKLAEELRLKDEE